MPLGPPAEFGESSLIDSIIIESERVISSIPRSRTFLDGDDIVVEAWHGLHVFCLSSDVIRNLNWKYTLLKFHILQIF